MNARISALISRVKRIRLIEVAIAIAIIVGVIVVGRMLSLYKEGAVGTQGTQQNNNVAGAQNPNNATISAKHQELAAKSAFGNKEGLANEKKMKNIGENFEIKKPGNGPPLLIK
jgi:hypothetical protein